MAQIAITLDGSSQHLEEGTTGAEVFSDTASIIALRIDGELRDLDTALVADQSVEGVDISSPDGLSILRHSAAHVLAQAVQKTNPDAKLGIGPPITDGFYYDFDVAEPFTPESLKALEKEMNRIIKSGQRFVRREISDDAARAEEAGEPYKLELVGLKSTADDAAEGASVEVGEGGLSMYDNVDKKGQTVWTDLCRGPHLPTTKLIGNGFALTRSAAAYWRGSEKNPMLQRVYGTAWPSKEELRAHQERIAEAERRDHRRLGSELDLFSFPDEIGSGLPVFHPKGAMIKMEMEDYSRRRHVEAGYSFVSTPHITKKNLFETSKHLEWYADGMYPPMHVDEEVDADGNVTKQGQDYYLKPMNCPMHNLIYSSRGRSYRELPLRLFEFGSVYRYEKSGVVHGLTRARGFTQDDAHIYTTREQMKAEIRPPWTSSWGCSRTTAWMTSISSCPPEIPRSPSATNPPGRRRPAPSKRSPPPPVWTSFRTRAAPPSTARRSPCRRRTRSAAPGSSPPSSWTSSSRSCSSSSTPRPTAPASAR